MNVAKSCIVTAAAGGMGRTLCAMLADQQWNVLALDHNEERLMRLASGQPGITPLVVGLETTGWEARVEDALSAMPPLGGLVNMAGISRGKPIEQLSDDDWHTSLEVNATAAMRLTRLVAPRLRDAGAGSIVNVGSPVGVVGANKPSYAASKAALHGLTMSTARNLGPDNIRVNTLLPGPTITEMTRDWPQERRESVASGTFLKRLCQPEDIANMIAFMLSDKAGYLTGSTVDMSAGSLWGH